MFSSNVYRLLTVLLLLGIVSGIAYPDSLWVMDMSSCLVLHRYPASGGDSDLSLNVPGIPYNCTLAVACDAERLWVLGPMGCCAIQELDPATGGAISVITLEPGFCATALAYGGGSLWVARDNATIERIDPSSGQLISSVRTAVSSQVLSMASDGDYLWVIENAYCERIHKLDPSSGAIVQTINLAGFGCISAMTCGSGHLWVTGSRTISKINPADGSTVGAVSFGSGWPFTALAYQQGAGEPARMTVSQARVSPSGTRVIVESAVVTARFTDHAYVESGDRASGIRVTGSPLPERGSKVGVEGTIEVCGGEKAIRVSSILPAGSGEVDPLGMPLRSAAVYGSNSGALSALGTKGLCSAGLLVRTWGRVTSRGTGFFYIDDGSHLVDGVGNTGLRVLCDSLTPPAQDKRVQVTGIGTLFPHEDSWLPALHLRDASDLRVLD